MNYSDLPAFCNLEADEIERFVGACQRGTVAADRIMLKQGDRANRLLFVVDGTVRAFISTPEGDRDLAEITAPTILGEISFFSGEPNSASVVTVTPVRVLVMPFETLRSQVREGDRAAAVVVLNLAEAIAKRAAAMTRQLAQLYSSKPESQLTQLRDLNKELFGEWSFI